MPFSAGVVRTAETWPFSSPEAKMYRITLHVAHILPPPRVFFAGLGLWGTSIRGDMKQLSSEKYKNVELEIMK